MKRFLLACALATAACAPRAPSDHAQSPSVEAPAAQASRLETLTADAAHAQCTTDGAWCATTDADAVSFVFSFHHQPIASFQLSDGGHELWPQIVRSARSDGGEDALVGISHDAQQAYSGGGGQVTQVSLYRLSTTTPAARAPQAALTFPASAAIDVRACFSPADARRRRDACSDQYNFTGTLSLDSTAAPPKLVLVTQATTYPAGISRNQDNTRALSAGDLRRLRDETCSYRRVFTWDPVSQTYKPDAPLPDCSDYLEP